MRLIDRLRVGFGLARRSGRMLRTHPKLLLFPVVGAVSGIAFVLTLFGGLFLAGPPSGTPGPVLYGALFGAYLVETFVASFASAALVASTRTALRGGEPTVRGGLAAAWARKRALLVWSVVAAVVGVVIRAIESQDNLVARLLAGVFSVAWGVMTYFVVPVIVFRDPSVRGMFGESARTFRETWGESVGAMGAVNLVTVLLAAVAVGLGAVTYVLTPGAGGARLLPAALVGGTALLLGLLIGNSLTGVAKTVLYVHATEDTTPAAFADVDLDRLGPSGGSTAREGRP